MGLRGERYQLIQHTSSFHVVIVRSSSDLAEICIDDASSRRGTTKYIALY